MRRDSNASPTPAADTAGWARLAAAHCIELITRIVARHPLRAPCSPGERGAQDMLKARYDALGLDTHFHAFRFNDNLYLCLCVHFAVGLAGSALWFAHPLAALALHLLAGVSYLADAHRWFYLLRRLHRHHPSQNLVAIDKATAPLRTRIVFIAHADAAYTGWVFHPKSIRSSTQGPITRVIPYMRKSLGVATLSLFALAVFDAATFWLGATGAPWQAALALLSIPTFLAALLNGQVVVKNTLVPGANDNLSGCAGGVELAARLHTVKPADVELVYVASGCEEAGCGGAHALARDNPFGWHTANTTVLAIDGLTNGVLRLFTEGEVYPLPAPPDLLDAGAALRREDPRFAAMLPFDIPTGATDGMPFLRKGYPALGLGCVDPNIGAPRGYHRPEDTPENLDPAEYALSLEFIERYARRLMAV